MKLTIDNSRFLLHDVIQGIKKHLIAYVTQENLEQLSKSSFGYVMAIYKYAPACLSNFGLFTLN